MKQNDVEQLVQKLIKRRPPLTNASDDSYAEKLERLAILIPELFNNRYAGSDTYFDKLDKLEGEVLAILNDSPEISNTTSSKPTNPNTKDLDLREEFLWFSTDSSRD